MPDYTPNFAGVIDALKTIIQTGIAGVGGSGTVMRIPSLIITSSSGTILSGTVAVAIANIGSANGSVLGVSIPSGVSVEWKSNLNDKLNTISYDATGTTFLINILT